MSHCWLCPAQGDPLSSQGNNITYNNMCVAENEARSVWEPFHVQQGFKPEESTVSLFRGWTMIDSSGAASNRPITEELNILYGAMAPIDSNATIILDPLVARELKENQGFKTKEDFSRHLAKYQNGRRKYWGFDAVDMLVGVEAARGVEPYASWKKLPADEMIAPITIRNIFASWSWAVRPALSLRLPTIAIWLPCRLTGGCRSSPFTARTAPAACPIASMTTIRLLTANRIAIL